LGQGAGTPIQIGTKTRKPDKRPIRQSCKAGKLHSADEIISFALDEREYRLSGAFFLEQ